MSALTGSPAFVEALEGLKQAKKAFVLAESSYRAAYAKAWLESTEKTADGRKYSADLDTVNMRIERDVARCVVEQTEHVVLHLRGREAL